MAQWGKMKGINVLATGDFTHPFWFDQLKNDLEEAGNGLYKLSVNSSQLTEGQYRQPSTDNREPIYFLLSCEISSIYTQGGKGRRIHNLFFFPSLTSVEKFNKQLINRRANLRFDGRPIVGMSSRDLVEIALSCDDKALIIPAHAWTPWFSVFGSFSGFDSIEECFGDLSSSIFAIETGLSSDPAMNWRIEELKSRSIVSFSDAHSPAKLGREATVFELSELSYEAIRRAITGEGKEKIAYTIEFYPEEGKYHYTGHRNCKVVYSPNETRKLGTTCPICGRPLTVGVMSRVEHLGKAEVETKSETDEFGVRWIKDAQGKRPGYVMLVPLLEILSEALGSGVGSQKVIMMYESLISSFASEFNTLLNTSLDEITRISGERVAEAVSKVRSGDIVIEPGYDGVFGKVNIWKENQETKEGPIDQGTLF
jgi:uncharacterized protein (TIGR00375 family)